MPARKLVVSTYLHYFFVGPGVLLLAFLMVAIVAATLRGFLVFERWEKALLEPASVGPAQTGEQAPDKGARE